MVSFLHWDPGAVCKPILRVGFWHEVKWLFI
jgi:hypothetical protein